MESWDTSKGSWTGGAIFARSRNAADTLLSKDVILIGENLTGLRQLLERELTFFAIPVKVRERYVFR
jgi:kynurenine formamidase